MDLFETVAIELTGGQSVVLAVIAGKTGSAPRSVGTRTALLEDFSTIGTIGGGALESEVLQLAREVLLQRKWVVRNFDLTSEDAARAGMICGGRVQVLIHFVDASNSCHLELYQAIASSVKENKKAWLVTHIPAVHSSGAEFGDGPSPVQDLCFPGGPGTGMPGDVAAKVRSSRPEQVVHNGEIYLVEPLGRETTVYIFGAGHIALELVPLAHLVGFKTVVLDDRPEFADPERFSTADCVTVLDSFESGFKGLEIGENSYLVLVTRGHLHDLDLIRQALGTRAGYIGMIGSKRKRHAINQTLMAEGFTNRDLERIHSPVGIDIRAETPEEIAVSIVAELIQTRALRSQP